MLVTTKFNKSKLKYNSNGKIFLSDVEALEYSKNVELQLDYRFFTESNWKAEPPNPIFYYFDRHAKIISEKYDHIILTYSGGTDSHTILESFIRCGIRNLDIRVVDNSGLLKSGLRRDMDKIFYNSLEKYKTIFKDLNYTVSGLSVNEHYNFSSVSKLEKNFVEGWADTVLSATTQNSWYILDSDARFITKPKTCVIFGFEKPNLTIKDSQWCWQMNSNNFIFGYFDSKFEYDTVFFFMTDDVPELHIKLTWLKIKIMEKLLMEEDVPINSNSVFNIQLCSNINYRKINHHMGYRGINYILDSNLYKAGGLYQKIIYNELERQRKEAGISYFMNEYMQEAISKAKTNKFTVFTNTIPIKAV